MVFKKHLELQKIYNSYRLLKKMLNVLKKIIFQHEISFQKTDGVMLYNTALTIQNIIFLYNTTYNKKLPP